MSREKRQETKLQQARFLAEYLSHGNARKAYVDSGYEGDPGVGSSIILKRPAVQAWLAEAAEGVASTAIEIVKEQTVDKLQTREGLSSWLVSVVKGEETQDIITKDGDVVPMGPRMGDRLKAAELLAKIQGHLAPQKIDVNATGAVFHFHTVDNQRGGAIPASVVQIVESVADQDDHETEEQDDGHV